ncbi:putative LRR containing protein [Trachipleistophora hominis]|uniref:Putative LRR containing protein n=1 Tax=Trachipleistophora hominis TaxID=72359 RepID=L7JTR0_TRAHO|nr:putative LRR containing protein [Trachipleistophora hominis]
MVYRCYSTFKALEKAKSCSAIHESVTCPEDKILQEIDKKISETRSNTSIGYKVIILPISKQLYEKLSCSSWTSETKFSIDEMCDLLVMLPHFIEKGSLVAFLMFKNLLNDESLYLKLEKIFIAKSKHPKKIFFLR